MSEQPLLREFVQVIWGPDEWMPRLVTDNVGSNSGFTAIKKEILDSGKGFRAFHSFPVHVSLQFDPCVFAAGASQESADVGLRCWNAGRDEVSLERDRMEDL